MLRLLLGLVVLAAIDLFGEWIATITSAPLPGNVIAMLILAALLATRVVPLRIVEDGADFLLKWLALLFVPAAVSVVRYGALLRGELLGVTLVVVVTTLLVLLVTGAIAERLVAAEKRER